MDLFRPRSRAKGLELNLRLARGVPTWLEGDSSRLRQVLLNLIGNAVKFTSEGQIEVCVEERTQNQQQRMRDEKQRLLHFSVRDTGIGISAEAQRQLFNPFIQGDLSMTRRFGGTGLGLAISKRVVEMMGGQVEVESVLGQGSTFSFTIPFLEGSASKAYSSTSVIIPRPRGRRCRILVVEDDPTNRLVVVSMMKDLDFEVDLAENGLEALKLIDKRTYELILMDCQMPELDGYETSRRIRRREMRHVPIIAVTAHAMKGDREKCLAAGMDDYISKPYREKQLRTVLERWLSRRGTGPLIGELAMESNEACQTLDEERIDILRGLDALEEVIEIFLGETPKVFDQVRAALADDGAAVEKRATDLEHLGHRLKGSAANVGANELSRMCKALEFLAKGGTLVECPSQFELIKAEYTKVEAELRALLDQTGSL